VQVQFGTLYFSPTVGGLAGTLSTFNLASYQTGGDFVGCATITINDSNNLADYLVLIARSGDLLAFTGDFPGSANWQLVVRTKIPSGLPPYSADINMVQYGPDAFVFVGFPLTVLSVRTIIQEGLLAAEAQSPIAKQKAFLREDGIVSYLKNVVPFSGKNALLAQVYTRQMNRLLFGDINTYITNCWLYIDLDSGAVSPISYTSENNAPFTDLPYRNKTICHADGYIYTISVDPISAKTSIWRLLDDTASNTRQDVNTFLQFPESDLGLPDQVKTASMAYVKVSRYNGYAEANLAVCYDQEKAQAGTFTMPDGAAAVGVLETKRVTIPVAGQGEMISPALINKRRPKLSCESISIQFEDGGPY
jgi:hypothetical protein